VALRHLVLHQVLAHLDEETAVTEIVEVDSVVCRPWTKGNPGAWSPRQVYSDQSRAPVASSGGHAADVGVEQGEHVGEPEQPELAGDPCTGSDEPNFMVRTPDPSQNSSISGS
jgi:hypothetical protein